VLWFFSSALPYPFAYMTNAIQLSYTLHDLPDIARQLVAQYAQYRIWLFDAPMGAGKTTLIQQICHCLQATDAANSPTYSIVNEYHTAKEGIIYHIDLYRLRNTTEALAIGIEDYLYQENAHCFIEWYTIITDILPPNCVYIRISLLADGQRQLEAHIA
jgi:tRNA threonylcarbamoyladenosine biosynthesis protein TsaE